MNTKPEIPYDKIDPEMRELIRVMNDTGFIKTGGCCIGHDIDPIGNVIFKVKDGSICDWKYVLIKLLELNRTITNANINIYEWHRLDPEGFYLTDWILQIQAHPRMAGEIEPEEQRVLGAKVGVIDKIVYLIKKVTEEKTDEQMG